MRPIQFLLPRIFLIAITGCQPGADVDIRLVPTPSSTLSEQQIETVAPSPFTQEPSKDEPLMTQTAPTSPSDGMEFLIEKAEMDLAHRLSISVDQINLIEAKPVTWPDSSLGCPQSGMLYTQVLTQGYLIILNAGGQVYEYHAGRNGDAFLCENPTPPVPSMPGDI